MRWILALCFLLIGAAAQGAARPVTFESQGAVLHGYIVMPSSGNANAGVVLIHGSGPDGAQDYLTQAESFARGGIAALVYDKRGWNKSGGDWQRRPFSLLAQDAIAAAQVLRRETGVPPDRVGYWGISQGGWVIAEAASRDPQTAFVIGVAATGVSPTSQELWHKDQMMQALGYSPKARAIATDFWRMVFDFLVKVDGGLIPLPADILTNERAAASVGLTYEPLTAWSKVKAPVLLLYGDQDLLEPAVNSAAMIEFPLALAGNAPEVLFFPGSSHAITTRQTGLTFDWGEAFHPDYYPVMLEWISTGDVGTARARLSRPSGTIAPYIFHRGAEFGEASISRGVIVQLSLFVVIPLFLLLSGGRAVLALRSNGSTAIAVADLAISVGGLVIIAAFVIFLVQSVFVQGLEVMESYTIPAWQRWLPVAGSFVAFGAAVTTILRIKERRLLGALPAIMLLIWCVSWRMVGAPL